MKRFSVIYYIKEYEFGRILLAYGNKFFKITLIMRRIRHSSAVFAIFKLI